MNCGANLALFIQQEAVRQGVDPGVAIAQAQRESGIQQCTSGTQPNANQRRYGTFPLVTGAAGEIGVFQLLPSTAAALGVDPTDAYQNIRGGITYLRQQLDRFGNYNDALAAYNAGPGRVASGNIPDSTYAYVDAILGVLGAPIADVSSPANPWDVGGVLPDVSAAADFTVPFSLPAGSSSTAIAALGLAGVLVLGWLLLE